MKTLTLNTCRRLSEAGIEIETGMIYAGSMQNKYELQANSEYRLAYHSSLQDIPAPNLEEAIDLLPIYYPDNTDYYLRVEKDMMNKEMVYRVMYSMCEPCQDEIGYTGKTLLQAVEQMINYLLDNNLLGQTK